MGISIDTITHGYSKSGAVDFQNKLNSQAIVETQSKIREIGGIRTATEAAWQGKAQMNFMENLDKATQEVAKSLDECKQVLDAELGAIEEAINEQEENIVPLD